jgi:hypothetical protein
MNPQKQASRYILAKHDYSLPKLEGTAMCLPVPLQLYSLMEATVTAKDFKGTLLSMADYRTCTI